MKKLGLALMASPLALVVAVNPAFAGFWGALGGALAAAFGASPLITVVAVVAAIVIVAAVVYTAVVIVKTLLPAPFVPPAPPPAPPPVAPISTASYDTLPIDGSALTDAANQAVGALNQLTFHMGAGADVAQITSDLDVLGSSVLEVANQYDALGFTFEVTQAEIDTSQASIAVNGLPDPLANYFLQSVSGDLVNGVGDYIGSLDINLIEPSVPLSVLLHDAAAEITATVPAPSTWWLLVASMLFLAWKGGLFRQRRTMGAK